LEGVDDRASAEALRGLPLTVSRQQAPALAPGEWWSRELESCEVSDRGRRIGTVARVLELPSCEALEVQLTSGGAPLLVPMVKDAVLRIDTARSAIEIDGEFLGLGGAGADADAEPG
jgi:16S rRNA processing protein RimM